MSAIAPRLVRSSMFEKHVKKHCLGFVLGGICALLFGVPIVAQDRDDGNENSFGIQLPISDEVGHPTFASPHFNSIAVIDELIYVANTPADTLDVIHAPTQTIVFRINVGIDPVSLAVRPDQKEIWVANHVSDTISIVDTDLDSAFYHQIVATLQDVDLESFTTLFDEPVGIAFASNTKAYVALGPSNQIAIIDVAARRVTGHIDIPAQDPRAIVVRGNYLYVLAFESGNTSQLSGCVPQDIDGDVCTYDAVQETHTTNNVLSLYYDVDIVKNPKVPDRDLFIYNTQSDRLVDTVEGTGTLLYGLAVSRRGIVFIAQADARNTDNGRAGTQKHGLLEMENRAFLNQVTRVDCLPFPCRTPRFFELEPLPPEHPAEGMALATPFAVQLSDNDRTLVVTAAGSNKLFTMNPNNGRVLGRVDVGAVPRGLVLISDAAGDPERAWVHNAVENSVTLVDVSDLDDLAVLATIPLADPTSEKMRLGRMAYNDANASTTGTFSCESCHPDNNVDQIVWILDTPLCDHPGCTQIPPRLTMPVRGLRDTQPYHWDGIPGDPYGGVNTQSLWDPVDPNCDLDEQESCTRFLVDGSLATTMCDMSDCALNEEDKGGKLDAETRDALAHFILNVPFPPAPNRPFDNELSASAKEGFFEFNYLNDSGLTTGAQACGACHKAPFLTSTNTPSAQNREADVGSFNGMDAPTWRGAYDRWQVTPQARFNVIDLIERIGMDLGGSLPEQEIWFHAGARTQANWDMVLEFSTGFSGTFARQVTLSQATSLDVTTNAVFDALASAATQGTVTLHADGIVELEDAVGGIALQFEDGGFVGREDSAVRFTLEELKSGAEAGQLFVTLTARLAEDVTEDFKQPAIWPVWTIGDNDYEGIVQQSPTVEIEHLGEDNTLSLKGRHILPGSMPLVNGYQVEGSVECASGELPNCDDEYIVVTLAETPPRFGLNFIQVRTSGGLHSNDTMFYSEQVDKPEIPGNLIVSGGTFSRFEFPFSRFWNTVEIDGNDISWDSGSRSVQGRVNTVNTTQPWRLQISHTVSVIEGQEYSLCYRARAVSGTRQIQSYLDRNMHGWQLLSGERFRVDLNSDWQNFHHSFTVNQTDHTARVAFDLAQHSTTVHLDNIGLYEGPECGRPGVTRELGFRVGD